MPASSLVLYKNNTQTTTFALAASGSDKVSYLEGGRPMSTPHSVEISKKLSNGASNNLVTVVTKRVERNATTGKFATFQIKMEVSVPQDQSVITNAIVTEELGMVSSYLNDAVALEATSANRTALSEGRFA